MSEPFDGLTFTRATGILAGRGEEFGLSARTIPIFATLWHARGLAGTDVCTRHGTYKAQNAIRALRMILPRFGLAIRADGRGGYRLVDMQHQHEKASA